MLAYFARWMDILLRVCRTVAACPLLYRRPHHLPPSRAILLTARFRGTHGERSTNALIGVEGDLLPLGFMAPSLSPSSCPYSRSASPFSALAVLQHVRHISPEARSFIAACCCPEPSQRYTVEQLVNHPFLARPHFPPGGAVQTA